MLGHPVRCGPGAAVSPSGQHPNSESEHFFIGFSTINQPATTLQSRTELELLFSLSTKFLN